MKRLMYLILAIFVSCNIYGQLIKVPYQEVGFKNLAPVWIYSPIDSSLIGDGEFDGRNHFNTTTDNPLPYVIEGNYLYCAHHTSYQTLRVEGALLQKIDINTGKVIWQNHYDLRNNDNQEWIEAMFISENGMLNVVTDRRIVLDNDVSYNLSGDTCLISIRKYDKETGELKEHIKSEPSDANSFRIKNNKSNRTVLYAVDENHFQYYAVDSYAATIKQYDIDQYGHLLREPIIDTFKFRNDVSLTDGEIIHSKKVYKLSEDTLVSLDYLYNKSDPSVDTQTLITVYDNNLKKAEQFQIDSMLNFKYRRLYIRKATQDYIFISGEMYKTGFYDTIANIVINYEGKIIKQFTSVYDSLNHSLGNIFKLDNDSDFYLTTAGQIYYGLEFVKTNDSWVVDLYREYYAKDKNYLYSPDFTVVLGNKDILIFGYNASIIDGDTYIRYWPTWMRISGEDLGFRTSVSDLTNIPLLIYPNPASSSISISCEDNDASMIEIIDRLGRVVYRDKSSGCEEKSIDISGYASGLYLVRLMDDEGRVVGKGKFVKE